MWSRLKSLFRGRFKFLDDDEPPADRVEFLAYLAQHGVILVASEMDDNGMTVVVHRRANGEEVNPLFSTVGSVRRWMESLEMRQVTLLPSLRMRASWLVNESQLREKPLLFDPGCPWERLVTPEDLQVVAQYLKELGPSDLG